VDAEQIANLTDTPCVLRRTIGMDLIIPTERIALLDG